MVKPLFVRKLKNTELEVLQKGSSSNITFSARRCQILLASAEGKKSGQIAKDLNCSTQTVRNAINFFNKFGLYCIQKNTRFSKKYSVSKLTKKAKKHKEKGDLNKAVATYHQAIELYPSSAWLYYYLGKILIEQGNFEEAIVCYQNAIKFNPTESEHYNKLGEVYFKQRQLDKAVDCFKKAIALKPNSAWYYQNLGEALAQKGLWGKSVRYYQYALKLNPHEVQEYHNNLEIQADDPDTIQVDRPIFIVGCGHSGTSIMLAILGNHPALQSIPYESALFLKSESQIRETMFQWDKECIQAGKKRWIEKTPPHIFQIKKLSLYRPKSQFIIMLRDGRDVVCSLKYRKQYKSFEERVERWIYDNLAGLPYWNDSRVIVIKYENLITQTERSLQNIFNFLGENYTEHVMNYYQTPKLWYSSEVTKPKTINSIQDHHNLRNWQINQPLYDGRGRWKTEMTEEEKRLFKQKAQKYLVQFSYVKDSNW